MVSFLCTDVGLLEVLEERSAAPRSYLILGSLRNWRDLHRANKGNKLGPRMAAAGDQVAEIKS